MELVARRRGLSAQNGTAESSIPEDGWKLGRYSDGHDGEADQRRGICRPANGMVARGK